MKRFTLLALARALSAQCQLPEHVWIVRGNAARESGRKLTRISPASFRACEQAASDLGINHGDAVRLQRVAADQLAASGIATEWIPCLRANPNAQGGAAARVKCQRAK